MNVKVTHFSNPFSFFCVPEDFVRPEPQVETGDLVDFKMEVSDLNHGQYIAVIWRNKWARGIIITENSFLIWLIDYGIYLNPDDKTVYVELPSEHKKYPSKVYEASIHGVIPLDLILTMNGKLKHENSVTWIPAAINKARNLIADATATHFVPVALLSTNYNDIVIGDLYLEFGGNKTVNIIDELLKFPTYVNKNKAAYVLSLPQFYTTRRYHRACLLKPDIPATPIMTLDTKYVEYCAICQNAPKFDSPHLPLDVAALQATAKAKEPYTLTSDEVERYASMYININGTEYNVLHVILNKLRDLKMCERYKNHDSKGVGRGYTRHAKLSNEQDI